MPLRAEPLLCLWSAVGAAAHLRCSKSTPASLGSHTPAVAGLSSWRHSSSCFRARLAVISTPLFFSFKAWFLRIFLFPAFLFPSRAVAAHNIPSRVARVTSPCLHALNSLARRCAAGQVLMERYNFPSRSFGFLRFPLCSHYVSGVRSHWGRGNTLCLSSAFRKMPLLLCLYISVCACRPFCCLWSGVREHCRL